MCIYPVFMVFLFPFSTLFNYVIYWSMVMTGGMIIFKSRKWFVILQRRNKSLKPAHRKLKNHLAYIHTTYLETEESYSVDDIVFSVGSRSWQDRQEVVDSQREEQQETQKVAPDIHRLIGQNKNTAKEMCRMFACAWFMCKCMDIITQFSPFWSVMLYIYIYKVGQLKER